MRRTRQRAKIARSGALWPALLFLTAAAPRAASWPLAFEPNHGQAAGARFVARTSDHGLVLVEDSGFKFVLAGQSPASIHFLGAERHPALTASQTLPGRANYFSGRNLERAITGVPQYGRVQFSGIYPGIDAVLHRTNGSLEYDFLLAPHAEAGRIRLVLSEAV